LEDQSDVERTLAGDIDAFERIVRRWQTPLVNLAFRFIRDQGRAEELAQEAFLQVYRSLSKWQRRSSFSTWLFSIAMNMFRSECRRSSLELLRLEDVGEPHASETVSILIENGLDAALLHRAIHSLPSKYRDVIILFYLQELSLAETAETLGISQGTVKAHLFRSRELLKKKLHSTGLGPASKEERR
jgi:RNA polymerase sigma-70 factor (ECF subfamily)